MVFVFGVGCGGGIGDEEDGGVAVDPVGGDGEIVGGKGGAEDVGDEGEGEKGRETEDDDDFGGGVGVWVVVGVVEPGWRSHCVICDRIIKTEAFIYLRVGRDREKKRREIWMAEETNSGWLAPMVLALRFTHYKKQRLFFGSLFTATPPKNCIYKLVYHS